MTVITDGTTIDGRYEIVGTIGSGGFGSVYKAFQKQFDRYVALKVLNTNVLEEADGLARFELEAKTIAGLKHKNIVSFYGYGVWQEAPYMVMELIEGTSLQSRLAKTQRLDPLTAARIMKQVCEALHCAHENGVIHRDLKPNNIMLEPGVDGRELVKLIDFGLVKLQPGYGVANQKLTEAGCAVGTAHYMSPEQCIGGEVDNRADVYAAACILYQTITGELPFDGEEAVQIMTAHIHDSPKTLSERLSATPLINAFQAVVNKGMAKDPEDRYQSAAEMAVDLESIIRGESGKLAQQGRTSQKLILPKVQQPRPKVKKKLPWQFIATAVVLGTIAAGFQLYAVVQQRNAATARDTSPLEPFKDFCYASTSASVPEVQPQLDEVMSYYGHREGLARKRVEALLNEVYSSNYPAHARQVVALTAAKVYLAMDKHKEAALACERALSTSVESEPLHWDLVEVLGDARTVEHRFASAYEPFQSILDRGPTSKKKRATLGLLRNLLREKHEEEAREKIAELDRLLTPEQKNSPTILLLKISAAAQRKDRQATNDVITQLEAQPFELSQDPFEAQFQSDDTYTCHNSLFVNGWHAERERIIQKCKRNWSDDHFR